MMNVIATDFKIRAIEQKLRVVSYEHQRLTFWLVRAKPIVSILLATLASFLVTWQWDQDSKIVG